MMIDGASLLHDARRGGLPHLRLDRTRGVAVGEVTLRRNGPGRRITLVVDVPEGLDYCWYEARLLGRVASARTAAVLIATPAARSAAASALPCDVESGDSIAIPFVRS